MATYVMSDIHGQYEKYLDMLGKISFSEDDTLYILGDVIDRGPEPVKVLMDMTGSSQVTVCAAGVKEGVFFRLKDEIIRRNM